MTSTISPFLKFKLLGAPQLRLNEQSLQQTLTGKPLALLIYLAVTGQPHTRDLLAALLWSELSLQQARNNLRYILPMLRRAVGTYINVTPQTISFNRQAPYWQDVEVLRATLQANLAEISTEQLQTALDLYQGEFLAGFRVRNAPAFVTWLAAQQQELHNLTVRGLLHLAERQLAQHDHAASHLTQQRLLTLAPQATTDLVLLLTQSGIDPAKYRHIIQALKTAGETQTATGQLYTSHRNAVAGHLLEKKVYRDHERLQTESKQDYGSSLHYTGSATICHALPNQLTTFFGREQEIADIVMHLTKPTYRLLTLIGEGGVGKTRLAIAVAQSILNFRLKISDHTPPSLSDPPAVLPPHPFPDGIWFVPLAHLTATADLPNQLATAIAKALQVPFNDQHTPTAQILHYLATKRTLLILDNFEHLESGVDFVLELLQRTLAVKLLITSRRRLNVQAEYPWRIMGLPVPALTTPTTRQTVQHEYASIALFVERARRAYPDFHLDIDKVADVVQICHFVQGLPLGIELAAALTKEYTCTELWGMLRHNYHILATTLSDLPDRHRNIKVVLDHSWRFLSTQEASVLAGCSVFCGAFDREAAMAITEASPAILARLVDQSLLHWRAEAAGRRWLDLHQLVRQYAEEQLAAAPLQQHQVQARHAAYYMAQLQEVEILVQQNLTIPPQMRSNLTNIRAAWLWSSTKRDYALLEQGLAGLTRLYRLFGLYHDGIEALQATLTALRQAILAIGEDWQQQCLFARLLNSAAEFCRHLGWLDEGERLAQEALELGRHLGNAAGQGRAYHELARLAQRRGQHMQMRTLAEQACTFAEQAALPRLAAKSLASLGTAEVFCGNIAQSNRCFDTVLRYLQDAPDAELEAIVRINLAAGNLRYRNYTSARRDLTQALAIHQALNTPYRNGPIYVFSGILWSELGATEKARQEYLQALTIFQEVYEPYWEGWARAALAHLLKRCGKAADAKFECQQVLKLLQGKMPMLEHCVLTYLGDIYANQGDRAMGEQFYRQALSLEQRFHLRLCLADPIIQLADLLFQCNEAAQAQALLEEPLAALEQHGLSALAEPFVAYWTGYQVFNATDPVRAQHILHHAYTQLQEQVASIDDPALRHSFLNNVLVNHMLMDAAHATGIA